MPLIDETKYSTMTAALNNIKSPNGYLRRTLFRRTEELTTDTVQTDILEAGRRIAPFVRRDAEGIMVPGYTAKGYTISPPNIRIKRPFTPSELLFGRRPGEVVYVDARRQRNAAAEHIARDLGIMEDMIANAEEWLCSQIIQGAIEYAVADQEVWSVTSPKPNDHNFSASVFWDDATPEDVDIYGLIHIVKRLINNEVDMAVTDALLGTEAADAFLTLARLGHILAIKRDTGIQAGSLTFNSQFNADGVIYLGELGGVRFWEYGRSAALNGVETDMIRSKYAEFFAAGPRAERLIYYGAITDMEALQGRRLAARRFTKAWTVPDPSAIMHLVASRPLPWIRRPGAHVSVKVVSG